MTVNDEKEAKLSNNEIIMMSSCVEVYFSSLFPINLIS